MMTASLAREVKQLVKLKVISKDDARKLLGVAEDRTTYVSEQLELDFTDVDDLIASWFNERGIER